MKKLVLLLGVAVVSCGKFNLDKRIQGTWKMSEAKYSGMPNWLPCPQTEPSVVITEDFISNPYNTSYSFTEDKKHIVFNNVIVEVTIKKNSMLWVSNTSDSLRFTR